MSTPADASMDHLEASLLASSSSTTQAVNKVVVIPQLHYRVLCGSIVALLITLLVLVLAVVKDTPSVTDNVPIGAHTDATSSYRTSGFTTESTADGDLPNILTPVVPYYPAETLPGQVKTATYLHLLSGLYEVAVNNGGNRAVQNSGFNASVEYILKQIADKTNLVNVERSFFPLRRSTQVSNQVFSASFGSGANTSYSYNEDWITYSNAASVQPSSIYLPLLYVANGGCSLQDWADALGPDPADKYWAVVDRNLTCPDAVRIGNAQLVGATGIMIPASIRPTSYIAPSTTKIPVISLSNTLGAKLIQSIKFGGSSAVTVYLSITISYTEWIVSNICGDTPAGDPTSVVLVGGHSDGVAAGPGMNDDGSGTTSTLTLAIAMTRLMNNASLNYKPVNMVKFCWFGAEELGLLGSAEIVRVGIARDGDPAARVGSRARDWAIMIDLDMMGSLNFQNWVYDAEAYIPPSTPVRAHQGSKLQSQMFFNFFDNNTLPRNSETFDGRSDYGPFLVAGIPAGGPFAGADKRKSESERVRYQQLTGWGGVANAINDQCYHRPCDTIDNIHWGVATNMTMAAANVLETFAMTTNLRKVLGNPLESIVPDPYDHLPFEYRYSIVPREEGGYRPYDLHF